MGGGLAEQLINRLADESTNNYSDQWGIDAIGFPWPKPVNAQAVAARLFFKYGRKNGVDNIFKIGEDLFIDRKKIVQNKSTLLSLYDRPKIVLWASEDTDAQDTEALWKQIKQIISSEWPIVWAIAREIAPEYNKEYIRITDNLVWGKNESDILYM